LHAIVKYYGEPTENISKFLAQEFPKIKTVAKIYTKIE